MESSLWIYTDKKGKMKRFRSIILIITAFLLTFSAEAYDVVQPTEQFYVADYSDVINSDTEKYIVMQNDKLYNSTGAQICVVTVDFIGTAEIEDYAYKLFNDWGIGSAEKNNGILLLLVIGAEDYYAMQGSGIEKNLSSGALGDILYEYLEPDFAVGDYDAGVRRVFDALYDKTESIYGAVYDEYRVEHYEEEHTRDDGESIIGRIARTVSRIFKTAILIIVLIVFIIVSNIGRIFRPRGPRWGAPPRGHWRGHVRRPPPPPPGGFGGFNSRPRNSGFNRPRSGGGGSSFGGGSSRRSGGGFSGPRSGGGGSSRGGGAGRRR